MIEQSVRAVSPFVDTDPGPVQREAPSPWLSQPETPFVREYAVEGEDEAQDASSEALGELFAELYDEEFEVATEDLVDELGELAPGLFTGELDDPRDAARAELVLREALEPVAQAAEAYLSEAEARFRSLDEGELTGDRVLSIMNEIEPRLDSESPAFEQFLGGLVKKFKKVAKGAVSLAKKGVALAASPLLAPLIAKLKTIVRPLLDRVLKFALNKVPAAYRPLAQTLLNKLQGKVTSAVARATATDSARKTSAPAPALAAPSAPSALPAASAVSDADAAAITAPMSGTDAAASAEPATADVGDVQQGLDQELLELLVAREDEFMQEAPEARRAQAYRDHESADLARARARFVDELSGHLARGESPEPAIENFLPAVLMAVRAGVKLIGRPKVVSTIGGLIAKLIGPLVGKQAAPMLGNILADIGLRTFLQAEVDEGDRRAAVAQAVASTVEETARALAGLSETALDTPELLEVSALEAFETAAAANFPPDLIRPELREWEGPGTWLSLPLRGPKLFKKFSHVFDVTLAPQTAHTISTFGGGSLGGFLRDCLRLSPNAPVRARVHLYEAIPGTRLGHIARLERLRGLFSGARSATSLFHPLHARAAQALLNAPRLGREVMEHEDPLRPTLGQRFYYLEVPSAPVRSVARASHLHATVNLQKQEIRACLYLSEALAQKSSAMLRNGKTPTQVVRELRAALSANTASLGGKRSGARLRILGAPGKLAQRKGLTGQLHKAVGGSIRKATGRAAAEWLWVGLTEYLKANTEAFVKATEGPEDGVRICARFHDVPGLSSLKSVLATGNAGAQLAFPPKTTPRTTVTVHAGPKHD